MDIAEYSDKIKEFDKDMPIDYYYLGLASEAGEVCDLRKRVLRGDEEYNYAATISELGDVLWYVVMLADHLGIQPSSIMEANVRKLTERHGQKKQER